jgi:outer membrane protein assembly factor BamB
MRCPNLACRQAFTVKAMEEKAPAPSYELPPEPGAEPPKKKPTTAKPPAAAKPPKPTRAPNKPPEPEAVEAVVVEAAVVKAPKVKEVVWSEGTDVPPPGKRAKKSDESDTAPDDLPVRRKRKNSRGPLLLAVMLVSTVAIAGFGIFYVVYYGKKNEEILAKQAKEQYEKANYGEAAKSYEKLVAEYPGSSKVDEYKFFSDLASMQTVVRGVTNREDYDAAVKRLTDFIEAQKDSPLSKPGSGFGRDVLEAGKLLSENIAAHAEDRVKAFQADRTKSGELPRADKAIAAGRALVQQLDPFRGPDEPPLDSLKASFERVEKMVKRERDRTAAITRAREKLDNATDTVIQEVEAELAAAGLADDPEVVALLAGSKGKLRELFKIDKDPADPQPAPPTAAASLLFVTPIGKTKAREAAPNDPPPTVFLCVARGILYAIEEDTGALLWATRVGPDVTDPPPVARVELAAGPTDVAVVASNVGNASAVAGLVLRTGTTQWYQPLPAPAAGPPIVVGTRAFVPVRDAVGTVFEFDLTTGARVRRMIVGQPLADRPAVLRPGTNLLYVAADARRLYVIDTGGKDDVGNPIEPRCAQVIATGHLSGTLRVPPLFIGPEGTEKADVDRWMVLAQAEGTAKTLLRAFKVEPLPPPAADGASVPETPATHTVALPVPGWITYPPVSDGERLAVASDTGQFRLFGVNQPGNADRTLFAYPAPATSALPSERTIPGLVIPIEESAYWVLLGGQLQRARLTLVPSKGQAVLLAGTPVSLGEPVHAAQVNARRDVACIVVRSLNSAGCRAVAFGLRDGQIRWERQLGIVSAKLSPDQLAPPIPQGDKFILVDEDGGIVAVPAAAGVALGQTLPAPPGWVLESAPANATGPTTVVPSGDGKTVYTLTPVNRDGPKLVVRRVTGGKLAQSDEIVAPSAVAGQPVVVGGTLLIPTADGFVNRYVPGTSPLRPGSLEPGPQWLGERKPGHTCSITPLTNSSFATSDGSKKVNRWEWPATGKWTLANFWDLRGEVTGAGVALPPAEAGGPPRVLFADSSGSISLFAADRPGAPLRRWQPGAESGIPSGRPSSPLATQAGSGRSAVVYAIDGKLVVAIDPTGPAKLWQAQTGEDAMSVLVGAPQPTGDDRWVLTDLAGRVVVIDGSTGALLVAKSVGLPGAVPSAPSGTAANVILTPLSDGSAVVTELPKKE